MRSGRAILLSGLVTAALSCSAFGQQDEKLGKLSFPTSCDPKVQAEFERGVAMLHSYWFLYRTQDIRRCAAARPQLRDGPLGHRARLPWQHAGCHADTGRCRGRLGSAGKSAGDRCEDRARARLDRGAERLFPRS